MNETSELGSEWLINQIAHALRNPIFAGLVQTELLALRLEKDSESSRALEMLRDQLHRLEAIITDMLLFGRPPAISPRPLKVSDLLRALATEFAQGSGGEPALIEVRVEPAELEVEWDPNAVRNILEPVITNAIQHSDPPHTIDLEAHETDRGTVTLIVRDQGAGIPDSLLSAAFVPFAPQHHGRPGLGLAIAQKFATALGGSLGLTTKDGDGTEVLLELPVRVAVELADKGATDSIPTP